MQPLSAENGSELPIQAGASSEGANPVYVAGNAEPDPEDSTAGFPEADDAEDYGDREIARAEYVEESRRGHAIGLRGACAAVLIVAAVFLLWRSRATVEYLSRTPEGRFRVLKESVAALFFANQKGALPLGFATGDTQQDAYFTRDISSHTL